MLITVNDYCTDWNRNLWYRVITRRHSGMTWTQCGDGDAGCGRWTGKRRCAVASHRTVFYHFSRGVSCSLARRVTAHRCTTPDVRPTTITTAARPPIRTDGGDHSSDVGVISAAHRPLADVIVTCQRRAAAHFNNIQSAAVVYGSTENAGPSRMARSDGPSKSRTWKRKT